MRLTWLAPVVIALSCLGWSFGGGSARERPLALADWPIRPEAARGRAVYGRICVGCHGAEGRGDGAAAEFLNPLPRNFQRGYFKFRSTPPAQLPADDDLVRTITCGLPGSAMPGFPLLAEATRRDLAAWVLHLVTYGRALVEVDYLMSVEGKTQSEMRRMLPELQRTLVAEMLEGRAPVAIGAGVPATPAALAQGRDYYRASCASCHGEAGRGDGRSATALRDWKDAEIIPRDFTSGVFRGGSTAADLYLRLRTGLAGTPMPILAESDEVIWSLVHYIRSLRDARAIPVTRRMGCDPPGMVR